jgi:GntR family transcriptional regulator
LIRSGLLYRTQGVGTFVTRSPLSRDHTRLTDFFEDAAAKGMQARAEVLAMDIGPAEPAVAEALAIDEGEPVLRIETLRFLDEEPITFIIAHIPRKEGTHISEEELTSQAIWTVLDRNRRDHRVARAVEELQARAADGRVAQLLHVEPGAPVLYKWRIIFEEDGLAIAYLQCYSRGDKYSCKVLLKRP